MIKLKEILEGADISFNLGQMPGGDPNVPLKDSFYMNFKNPEVAERIIDQVNSLLKQQGFEPIEYVDVGIVFPNPTNQQMSAVIRAFDSKAISGMGRTDITGI